MDMVNEGIGIVFRFHYHRKSPQLTVLVTVQASLDPVPSCGHRKDWRFFKKSRHTLDVNHEHLAGFFNLQLLNMDLQDVNERDPSNASRADADADRVLCFDSRFYGHLVKGELEKAGNMGG